MKNKSGVYLKTKCEKKRCRRACYFLRLYIFFFCWRGLVAHLPKLFFCYRNQILDDAINFFVSGNRVKLTPFSIFTLFRYIMNYFAGSSLPEWINDLKVSELYQPEVGNNRLCCVYDVGK